MFTSAIKNQTYECCSISLNPYGILYLESWKKKKRKRKAILLLACIADVRLLYQSLLLYTNIVFKDKFL